MPDIKRQIVAAQRGAEPVRRRAGGKQHILNAAPAEDPAEMPFALALFAPPGLVVPDDVDIPGANELTVKFQLFIIIGTRPRSSNEIEDVHQPPRIA